MPTSGYHRPIITEEDAVIALPRVIPRTKATPIPEVSIFDEPTYCLRVNKAWAAHFLGVILTGLNQPDMWKPDATHDVEWARREVVEWVARFLTEIDCMPADPCCPETNELLLQVVNKLVEIITQNTTVIENQVTIIDNSETVIEQNETEILNNYLNNWNSFVYNNEQMNIFNTMIYDGNPQSIAPNLPEESNFGTDEDALCLALKAHFDAMMYIWNSGTVLAAIAGGLAASVAIAVAAALAPVTLGGSVAVGLGIAANLLIGTGALVFNDIITNTNAQQKVLCCLFDTLKDSPITFEAWKNMGDGCTFPGEPNADVLLDMFQQAAQVEANYLGFLRSLGQAQGQGDANACSCCDAIIVAVNNCTVTPLGNCQWRITQTNSTEGSSDPFCSEGRAVFTAEFKDAQDRCIDIIASTQAIAGYEQIDCDDQPISGIGGGGGQGKFFRWWITPCPTTDPTFFDTTITVALVEE